MRLLAKFVPASAILIISCHTSNQAPSDGGILPPAASSSAGNAADAMLAPVCKDSAGTRWLGSASSASRASRPVSTPLTIVTEKVSSAGQGCCAAWAEQGSTWSAVDAYGQVVGMARITGSDFYSFTGCQENSLAKVTGRPGVDLFVSTRTRWQSPASAQWVPSRAERAGLGVLVRSLEKAMVPEPTYDCDRHRDAGSRRGGLPNDSGALFFRSVDAEGNAHQQCVIGGHLLIIAERQARGSWIATYVDAHGADACLPGFFTPKAVFDMNADGQPEIVVHTDEGAFFGDLIYIFENSGGWQISARGIPGSTA